MRKNIIISLFVLICMFALIGCRESNEVNIVEVVEEEIEYGEVVQSYQESATLISSKQQLEQFSPFDGDSEIEFGRNEEIKRILDNAMANGFFNDYALICIVQVEGQPIGVSNVENIEVENNRIIVTLRRPTINKDVDLPCVMTMYCYIIQIEKSQIGDNATVEIIKT